MCGLGDAWDSMHRNGDAQMTVWTCDAQDSIYRHGDAQGGCVDMVMPKTACVDSIGDVPQETCSCVIIQDTIEKSCLGNPTPFLSGLHSLWSLHTHFSS